MMRLGVGCNLIRETEEGDFIVVPSGSNMLILVPRGNVAALIVSKPYTVLQTIDFVPVSENNRGDATPEFRRFFVTYENAILRTLNI